MMTGSTKTHFERLAEILSPTLAPTSDATFYGSLTFRFLDMQTVTVTVLVVTMF